MDQDEMFPECAGKGLGAREIKIMQADGWRLRNHSPALANGWLAFFERPNPNNPSDTQITTVLLTNDMSRWPDEPEATPENQLELAIV